MRARRGSSFIEILIALAILAIVMVGILQMFTLSLLTNFGSAARTDLLYKAQQVVENLRLIYYLQNPDGGANDAVRAASGVPASLAVTASPIYLPYDSQGLDPMNPAADDPDTDLTWSHWGPRGFNIVEAEKLPYRLSYTVEARGPRNWLVTVTATPVDNPDLLPAAGGPLPAVTDTDNPRRFFGPGSRLKIVTYSAMIEN
jgi:prepilin-type N-terminal cleavage/methylation domain-containing protein